MARYLTGLEVDNRNGVLGLERDKCGGLSIVDNHHRGLIADPDGVDQLFGLDIDQPQRVISGVRDCNQPERFAQCNGGGPGAD